jgi:dUTP pyrophosphatase
MAKNKYSRYNSRMENNERARQILTNLKREYFKIEVEVMADGKMPAKANSTDAGFDLYATSDITIYPGQVLKHPLNIRMKLPESTWAEITSKSGLGAKGLLVYAGVIDQSYRGVPHVVMSNINVIHGLDPDGIPLMRTDPIVVKKGEKLAQLIMNPFSNQFYIEQVEKVDTNTDRGEGGFGSSGK